MYHKKYQEARQKGEASIPHLDKSGCSLDANIMVAEYPIIINEKTSKKYKAIADFARKNEPYSIVTQNYKLVRHEEIIDAIESTLKKIDACLNYEVVDLNQESAAVKTGARIHKLYRCKDIKVNVTEKDIINAAFQISNSYDTSKIASISLRSSRLICLNDAYLGHDFIGISGKHTKNIEIDTDKIKLKIEDGIQKFIQIGDTWKQWRNIKVPKASMVKIIKHIFDADKHQQASIILLNMLEPQHCHLYALWNLLTRVNTHSVAYDTARRLDAKILNTVSNYTKRT